MVCRAVNRSLLILVFYRRILLIALYNGGVRQVRKDRLIVGLLCIAFAVWTFLADNTIGPAIGIGILGLITVAIARKR